MKKDTIFIHIPKTGGTTIIADLEGKNWQSKPDFNYRHVQPNIRTSNAGDIFNQGNFEKYRQYKIFMMLRHPVDRAISDYYFFKGKDDYMSLFRDKPANFLDYVKNPQSHNNVVSFLMGRTMFTARPASEDDLELIKDAIEQLPVHVGIFEHFAESLEYFSEVIGIEWSRKLVAKRMSFTRPKVHEISEELQGLILENNRLDLELYHYGLTKFEGLMNGLRKPKVSFILDRYDHVAHFMERYSMFDNYLENRQYIRQNAEFFKGLSKYLIQEERISDGKLLLGIWNATYLNTVATQFPGSPFLESLLKVYDHKDEPIKQLEKISSSVDKFIKDNPRQADKIFKPMKFDRALVVSPRPGFGGIIKSLFWS